jgi:hypothetical protein
LGFLLTLADFDHGESDYAMVRRCEADDEDIAFAQMRGCFLIDPVSVRAAITAKMTPKDADEIFHTPRVSKRLTDESTSCLRAGDCI